ncbi:MAG TPA: hypothetical protein VK327_15535 [Candidatus Paceibacterota bacterium]|nr:hypothetical protein [Candidatus Paceibacterota bacterium]
MATGFNNVTFHRRRKLLKITGLVLILAGIFTILDMVSTFPIPLTGMRAIYAGLVLLIFGFLSLYQGYKLPLAEAIELIHSRGRGITASELVHQMRVDRETADRIIAALIRKGFLRTSAQRHDAEEVFDPVQ